MKNLKVWQIILFLIFVISLSFVILYNYYQNEYILKRNLKTAINELNSKKEYSVMFDDLYKYINLNREKYMVKLDEKTVIYPYSKFKEVEEADFGLKDKYSFKNDLITLKSNNNFVITKEYIIKMLELCPIYKLHPYSYIIEVEATDEYNTLDLGFVSDYKNNKPTYETINMFVDWGDGKSEVITKNKQIHKYNKNGKYIVKVFGSIGNKAPMLDKEDNIISSIIHYSNFSILENIPNLNLAFANHKKLKNIYATLNLGQSATGIFMDCKNLEFISENTFELSDEVTQLASAFENTTNLKYLPNGIFANSKNLINAFRMFANSGIKQLNPNLFKNCVNLNVVNSMLYNTKNLQNLDINTLGFPNNREIQLTLPNIFKD